MEAWILSSCFLQSVFAGPFLVRSRPFSSRCLGVARPSLAGLDSAS